MTHEEDKQQICQLHGAVTAKDLYLFGQLEFGEYGAPKTSIRDKDTDFKPIGHIESSHALTIPYYFCFYLDSNKVNAYLCIQRYAGKSAYDILHNRLRERFKEYVGDDYSVEFKKLQPSDYIRQVHKEAAKINHVIISYDVPITHLDIDVAREIDIGERDIKDVKFKAKLQLDLKPFGLLDAGQHLYDTIQKRVPDLLTLAEEHEGENVESKLDVTFGGKRYKMDTDTGKDLAAYFDITDYIDVNKKLGFADPKVIDSIGKQVREILDTVIKVDSVQ